MATRKVWYTLSIALMIAAFLLLYFRGLNLATDFTGGVTAEASCSQTASGAAIRSTRARAGCRGRQVPDVGSCRGVAIRLPPDPASQSVNAIRSRLEDALKALDPSAQLSNPDV